MTGTDDEVPVPRKMNSVSIADTVRDEQSSDRAVRSDDRTSALTVRLPDSQKEQWTGHKKANIFSMAQETVNKVPLIYILILCMLFYFMFAKRYRKPIQMSVRWLQVVLGGQLTCVSLNRRGQDLIRGQDETVPPRIA